MDDDDMRDFLAQNPDYFQNNPELLGLIRIPHASGAAVSLVERQVSVLRDRNVDLRHRLRDLGSTARDNEQLFADTRTLVLALLDAEGAAELERTLLRVLRDEFGVEYAALILFDERVAGAAPRRVAASQARQCLAGLLGRHSAACGPLRAEEFEFLFPGAKLAGSAAVALIRHRGQTPGLLAVGSADAARYGSDMGTLFIEFAAEVIGRRLPPGPAT